MYLYIYNLYTHATSPGSSALNEALTQTKKKIIKEIKNQT